MPHRYDAVVVGAGPNGLAAAIALAQSGYSVIVLEAAETIGGGCRSAEITLPGFIHDVCAAVHPMGVVSPFFKHLPLQKYGLEWVRSPAAVAHPFDDGSAAVLYPSLEHTGETIAPDGPRWAKLMGPFLRHRDALFSEILKPVRVPSHPLLMARFGVYGLQSSSWLVRNAFDAPKARALFSGCAAHSFLALDAPASASFGLVLALAAHATEWPVVKGGSQRLIDALAVHLQTLGGEIATGTRVRELKDLPSHRTVLFDLAPRLVEQIAGDALPDGYRRQLRQFRHGPAVFKIDWALRGPIPWRAQECTRAVTVHLGSTVEDIEASEQATNAGRVPERPFVLLAQQSLFDSTRAPHGQHTGWAYCHVPHASNVDMTERIEQQVERFAPGFRGLILARRTMSPADIEAHNPNMIGGDIGGGANDVGQFVFRPLVRWNPYTTPNPRLYICSSSTPPGGGVHGMCGYWAAQAAIRQIKSRHQS
jgi:phytoene dehydrogenase-like protein